MTAKKTKSKEQRLKKELYTLQTNGTVVWSDLNRSNKAFYKHIAEILFWWLGAVEEEGYLDAEYAKLPGKFKSVVKYGVNFAPLFTLIWANNKRGNSDLDRHSRAFNKIIEEYFKRKAYYAKDGVARIAAYIEQNNGINGLTGYGKRVEEEDENKIVLTPPAATEKEKEVALLKSALSHYKELPTAPVHNFNTSLPITDEGLSVVLVRQTAAGYELLGATNDKQAVNSATIVNFKHTFSALTPSIRALIETLRTQSLPPHILKIQRELVDKSKQKGADGKNLLSMRRLLYRSETNDYLLSPVNGHFFVNYIANAGGAAVNSNATTNQYYEGFFIPNAVSYTSPSVAGFTFTALGQMKTGNNRGTVNDPIDTDSYQAYSLTGAVGSVNLAAGYDTRKNTYSTTMLGASTKFGDLTVAGSYYNNKPQGADSVSSYSVEAGYGLTEALNVGLQYGKIDSAAEKTLTGVFAKYALSKRTLAYATYITGKNVSSSYDTRGEAYTGNNNTTAVGIAHSF